MKSPDMRLVRSIGVLLIALSIMLDGLGGPTAAAPVTTLADGRTGTIEFHALTLTAAEFAAGVRPSRERRQKREGLTISGHA